MIKEKTLWPKQFLKPLLFVSLLLSSLVCSLLSSPLANATAPVVDGVVSAGWEDYIDEHLPSGYPTNWRDLNYALVNYDDSTFIFYVGDDTHFGLSDGGSNATGFSAGGLCRWNNALNGGPGCNPWANGTQGLVTDKVYDLHLTDAKAAALQIADPDMYAEYFDLIHKKPDFYVPYTLNVTNKEIRLQPKTVDTQGRCWRYAATLKQRQGNSSDNIYDWATVDETDYTAKEKISILHAGEYGDDYTLGILAFDCTPPASLISDVYALKLERIDLKIDGSSFLIDSANLECSDDGICNEVTPYEDCSTYGVDIIGGLGCVIRNFGTFLKSLLITLFVPDSRILGTAFDELAKSFNAQLGFLIAPFTFLGGILQSIINASPSTNCTIHLGYVFHSDSTINPCNLNTYFPTLYGFIKTIIQAGVLFLVLRGFMDKYHEVVKS